MNVINPVINRANAFLRNQYVTAVLTIFLILYAGLARPQLPQFIANLFNNAFFRLLVLFLIAWLASQNTQVALVSAVAFMVTISLLSTQTSVENFMSRDN